MPRRISKTMGRVDFQEKRENAMRPSRHLGYNHDQLGLYFLDREAFSLAESEFRRAVWLNPFEPMFQEHLVESLVRMRRREDARLELGTLLSRWPNKATSPTWRRAVLDLRPLMGTDEGPAVAGGALPTQEEG